MKSVHRLTPLSDLLSALTSAVATLVDAPAGEDVVVDSVAFIDIDDLAMEMPPGRALPEIYLQVGVNDDDATRWVRALGMRCPAEHRPQVVFSKGASPPLRDAAHDAEIALVAVHPHARWEMVHALIERITGHGAARQTAPESVPAPDTDLFGLAHSVSESTLGLVSIEDEQSRVLAYSADSSAAADEVRRLSVLGRQGPAEYLRWLQREGVFDRVRNTTDVVEVAPQRQWNTRRRLAIGIREPERAGLRSPSILGTIWVQEADAPLHADSAGMLRGAASIAARVLWRTRHAPSTDTLLIQRLFGAHGDDVDVAAVAETFGVAADGQAAVVGFTRSAARDDVATIDRVAAAVRLHASAFRQDCVTTRIGDRLYVLFPEHRSAERVTAWARQVIGRLERCEYGLRAAVAAPVAGLGDAARARGEVDRVLDHTADLPAAEPVTTLARSRTTVLLAEILALIGERPELRDPRLDALVDYDDAHTTDLCASLGTYLDHHGDVRAAAAALRIHPNTLRYRIRRATRLLGVELECAPDRLLLEIQLAVHRLCSHTTSGEKFREFPHFGP